MSNNELKKELGLVPALAIVIGVVIGSGVFYKPTSVFGSTGAPGLGIIAWILGGIISIAGGLTAAEVAASIPKTGGMLTYLKDTYGDVCGYLVGWAQTIVYYPANIAALGIIFGTQASLLLGMGKEGIIPIAIVTVIFLMILNSLGSKTGGAIQTVATICKLLPLVAIIVVGFVKGNGGPANLFPVTAAGHPMTTSLGSALVATMFAYDGWIGVGAIAGEMKNPGKDLPRAIIGGLSIVMAIYVLINVAYLYVLPASALAATKTPAADVATIIFGAKGGTVITIGILISIFGALNGNILTGMRIPYALALENKLPGSKFFGKLNEKTKMPIYSAALIAVIAIAFIFSGKFDQLTDMVVFVIWLFYVMTFLAVFVLRKKKPELHRPYKVPLYPIIPAIAIVGGIYIIGNTLVTQPVNAAIGLALTLIGLPVYYARKSKFKNLEDTQAE